jgi:hypothetical protein
LLDQEKSLAELEMKIEIKEKPEREAEIPFGELTG